MSNMNFQPRKSMLTKDGVTSRPLLPHERDEYTKMWFDSAFNKSDLGTPLFGLGTMVLSILGHNLFLKIVDLSEICYLTVGQDTMDNEYKIAFGVFLVGGAIFIKGVLNGRK